MEYINKLMSRTFITSTDFVRSVTNISSNIQDKFLFTALAEAEDIDFREIVGDKLYNKLIYIIDNEETGEPENYMYKNLLDISAYFIAYSVVKRLIVISSVKIDNIGANITGDDNVQNIDFNDLFKLEKYYTDKADVYKLKIQNYLADNYKEFPELCNHKCYGTDSNIFSAASCEIWLGGERGKRNNYYSKFKKCNYKN